MSLQFFCDMGARRESFEPDFHLQLAGGGRGTFPASTLTATMFSFQKLRNGR